MKVLNILIVLMMIVNVSFAGLDGPGGARPKTGKGQLKRRDSMGGGALKGTQPGKYHSGRPDSHSDAGKGDKLDTDKIVFTNPGSLRFITEPSSKGCNCINESKNLLRACIWWWRDEKAVRVIPASVTGGNDSKIASIEIIRIGGSGVIAAETRSFKRTFPSSRDRNVYDKASLRGDIKSRDNQFYVNLKYDSKTFKFEINEKTPNYKTNTCDQGITNPIAYRRTPLEELQSSILACQYIRDGPDTSAPLFDYRFGGPKPIFKAPGKWMAIFATTAIGMLNTYQKCIKRAVDVYLEDGGQIQYIR